MRAMRKTILRGSSAHRAVFVPFATVDAAPDPATEIEPVDPSVILEQERAEAEAAGYAAGYARGQSDGELAWREQTERLAALVDAAVHDVQATLVELETQIVHLALAVAGRVVEQELADHPELVVDVVRATLRTVANLPIVRVRVHPDDYQFLETAWSTITRAAGDPPVELLADATIQRGGCVVDTASGFADSQPRTRLDEIRMHVLPIVEGSQ